MMLMNEEDDQVAEDEDEAREDDEDDKEDSDAEAPGPRGEDDTLITDNVPAGKAGGVEPDKSDSDSEDAGQEYINKLEGGGEMDDKSDSDAEDPGAALAAAGDGAA